MSDELDFNDSVENAERPRDSKVDEAKVALLEQYFPADGTEVYYGRQLEIWQEKAFFHWITKKALNELAQERRINFCEEALDHHRAHFYWPRRHRYPRRRVREIIGLIPEFRTQSALAHWVHTLSC